MIERLVLKDFKSHEDSDIEFYPSLNVFLGEVGAGKTSILEAISFALFGRYAGNVNSNELIRRGAEKAEISLTFSINSGRYKIDRTIYSKKTQKARLSIFEETDWKLAVQGASAVSKSIEDLLDVDSSTFLAAIYASQGEIKEMLETQPGKRRERLDKLLGLDVYEKIWGTLGDARNLVLNELAEAQEKASGFELLEKQIEDLKDRLEKSREELGMLTSFLKEIEDRLEPAEQQLKIFEDLKQKLSQLETQINGKNNEIKNSSASLKSLEENFEKAVEAEKTYGKNKQFIQLEKDLEKEKRRIETALQQKNNLETLFKRDNDALQESTKRRSKLEGQIKQLKILGEHLQTLEKEKEILPELERKQSELEKKLDRLKEEAVKAFAEIENQKRKVERVAELGECPTCFQTVPKEHKEEIKRETGKTVDKLTTDYAALEEIRAHVQSLLDDLKKKVDLAQTADKEYVKALGQIGMLEGCREENEEVNTRIEVIKYGIKENRDKMAEIKETPKTLAMVTEKLRGVTSKAELAKEAEKQMAAKKDLETMLLREKGTLKQLKLQLSELQSSKKEVAENYDPKEHTEADNNVMVLHKNQVETTEGTKRLKKSMAEDADQIEQAEKQLQEKRKAWKQVQKLKMENKLLEVLRKSLREVIQPVMRKNNVLNVSQAFHAFYQELSNDNIDYAAIDEEGNVDVTRNGEPSPVNSLSGGETTCAALALRLAICTSLTKNQLLLLDEPTIHLDELYRAKLRDFLGTHNFEQLIVVTHDNTFDSLPAHIFKVEKRRGNSLVSPLSLEGDA
ncbi:MAG: SMC family ATPase [Candidatus Bathyarchaeota archaeon]|nr:SMC family ATPase [Candidatus Bathyarchaeota archaeon]MDH5595226.1 SMC family ATPase [Candidatus Bathyarchaeota archaeon]